MGNRRDYLISTIVEICQKMDQKGWVANHDGNVTLKYEDHLLATPTAIAKADIAPEMIIDIDMEGKKLAGIGKPFSEIKLHVSAYLTRPEMNAVIHAHPPFAMARGMVGEDFSIQVPEAVVSIGAVIPVTNYAPPGAPEHHQLISQALCHSDVIMMAGNGVLAVGRDVKEAYLRIELLEHLLKIDHYARSMGTPMTLPQQDKQKLLDKRTAIGLGPKNLIPQSPTDTPSPNTEPGQDQSRTDLIKDLITQELKKILK